MDMQKFGNDTQSGMSVLYGVTDADNLTAANVTMPTDVTMATRDSQATLKMVTNIVLTATLVIIMLGMGATIEIDKLLQHLRRPFGAVIGMLAQFVVLPLATFGLAHALQLEAQSAIGMLIMGSCPSGSTSNIFSYWADGDVPLSLTMTTFATVLALGMMPLNIWMYSRSWTDEAMVIPYVNIVISLASILIPAAVGIFLRWKWEKLALRIVKVGSFCGGVAVILTMTLMSILYPFMYKSSWKIYFAAFCLPFIGFGFGYAVAKAFRMNATHARTIALETGIQNFPLCMTVIALSFSKELIPKLALFPLLYGVMCLTNSSLFVFGYHLIKKVKVARENNTKKNILFKGLAQDDAVEMGTIEPK